MQNKFLSPFWQVWQFFCVAEDVVVVLSDARNLQECYDLRNSIKKVFYSGLTLFVGSIFLHRLGVVRFPNPLVLGSPDIQIHVSWGTRLVGWAHSTVHISKQVGWRPRRCEIFLHNFIFLIFLQTCYLLLYFHIFVGLWFFLHFRKICIRSKMA